MFLAGISDGEAAALVIIEKSLKNLQKHYLIKSVRVFPSDTDCADIENEIAALYNDPNLTVTRRVFSQDRRPAKRVKIPPLIVIAFTGTDTSRLVRLRKRKIPAEGISLCKEETWRKEDYGPICLGNNYYVPEYEPMRIMTAVLEQHRLIIEENMPDAENLIREISRDHTLTHGDENRRNIISALSLPLWFSENVRVIKRY